MLRMLWLPWLSLEKTFHSNTWPRNWGSDASNYRIIYQIKDEALVVLVVKIGHRSQVYR